MELLVAVIDLKNSITKDSNLKKQKKITENLARVNGYIKDYSIFKKISLLLSNMLNMKMVKEKILLQVLVDYLVKHN